MNAIAQAVEAGIELDEQNCIAEELPCIGCNYLLRGMRPDQDCPECGKAISDTTRIQRLGQYPLPWLKKMSHGLRLIQFTSIVFAIAMVLFAINLQQNMRMNASASLTIVDILFVTMLFPGAGGFWLLTEPYQKNEHKISWRRAGRFMTTSSVVGFILCLIIPQITESIGLFPSMGILTAWFGVGAWAILQHASAIARLIPHQRMARLSKRLSVFTLVFLIACASYGGYLSLGLNSMNAPLNVRSFLYNTGPLIGAGILVILCGVFSVLLHWYHKRFGEAIALRPPGPRKF